MIDFMDTFTLALVFIAEETCSKNISCRLFASVYCQKQQVSKFAYELMICETKEYKQNYVLQNISSLLLSLY